MNGAARADDQRLGTAFPAAAHQLCAGGLAVIPLGGDDGKVPLVTWKGWRRPPGRAFIDNLIAKYPGAGIGVLCGLSRITVVDVDDPTLVEAMVDRFGATPLAIRTPRGGRHLWYRRDGERCATLRQSEGLAVDIKSQGGFVVVPPSPGYQFVAGSWADLAHLPTIKPGSLTAAAGQPETSLRAVGIGRRNTTLFRLLLREVRACDTEDDLLDVAQTLVDDHFELNPQSPFAAGEIAKTVRSVWRIEQEGRNWVGQEARVMTTASQFLVLSKNPDAYVLWTVLRFAHSADPDPFAISCKAMAEREIIDGWTYRRRYMNARDWLLQQGLLVEEQVGGTRPGDVNLYRFATLPAPMGDKSYPNIRVHPSPWRSSGPPRVVW